MSPLRCICKPDVATKVVGLRQPSASLSILDDGARYPLECGKTLVVWVQCARPDRVLRKGDRLLSLLFVAGTDPRATPPIQEGAVSTNGGPTKQQHGAGAGSGPAPARGRSPRFDARAEEARAAYRIALFCTVAFVIAACSSLFT